MGRFHEFNIPSVDGADINAWSITPDKPVAVMLLVHGMMEHSGRYREFAKWLAGKGIAVYMNDHRGHGRNLVSSPGDQAARPALFGHFADRDGWLKSVETLHDLLLLAKQNHPDLPVFILGHSMGSLLVQSFLRRYSHEVDGAILSGPLRQPGLLLLSGIGLVKVLWKLYGPHHRSKLMIQLGYGSYSKYFKPKRTGFDWLCSDPKVVDDYVADPLCGFPLTTAFYADLFRGLRENSAPAPIRKDLPLLIFAGGKDPAGHFGRDPVAVAGLCRNAGLSKVDLHIWPDGRHEMLNETNKVEVWEYLLSWTVGQLDSWQ
jgi:alpha-beta hydrolase superfamily lysophospholipase